VESRLVVEERGRLLVPFRRDAGRRLCCSPDEVRGREAVPVPAAGAGHDGADRSQRGGAGGAGSSASVDTARRRPLGCRRALLAKGAGSSRERLP
jgi:hypothetical protein